MNNKEHTPAETKKVDLFGPNCDQQLTEAIAIKASIEIEVSDTHSETLMRDASEGILNGDLMIQGVVVIRIKVRPVKLATYRDPITRRKAGHTPKQGGRKRSFPYPDASVENEAYSTLEWRITSCDPAMLRMIVLLAEPGSIQVGGDPETLKSLIHQAQFALSAFKIRRLRKPFEHFIETLQHTVKRTSSDIW